MFDGDFIVQFAVDVISPTLGKKRMTTNLCDGVLLWVDLPEMYDLDNIEELLSPKIAALNYMKETGYFLDKSINLNKGDHTAFYCVSTRR